MNRKVIKSLVDNLLKENNLTTIPVDVKKVAKLLGAEIKEGSFKDTLSGFALQEQGAKYIGVNSSHSTERKRFTIAHEIGHLYLHKKQGISYEEGASVMMFRNSHSSDGTDLKEIEANRFAAELLMPEESVRADLKLLGDIDLIDINGQTSVIVQKLAKKYKVSPPAMSIRLTTLYFG